MAESTFFGFVDEIQSVAIQMKATEQYFPVVLFIMLYKVILTFESVDEILKCDHSDESYRIRTCIGRTPNFEHIFAENK